MSKGEIEEIGKYRILGQIGEGAMGVVYRALDPVLNRPVAIKVMSDALARDTDLRGRFLREAQSAGSLQHPNVITIYDFGEVDGHPFIAMEFVEGADLNEILGQNSQLTLVEKIDVLIDVLNGLAYAHKRGIVHRDIKPANIRIDEEGRARIMDFGIAHLTSSNITRTGVMVGTPAYMAPEQITDGAVSAASDIFSVGAVMYELLTGTQAFRGETLQSVMYKIVSVPTPPLRVEFQTLRPEQHTSISKALDAIVARALDKQPAARFENAQEMATALADVRERVLEGQAPVRSASLRASVARVMADAPESKTRRARRRIVAVGVGAGVLVAGAAIALYVSGRQSRQSFASVASPAIPPATVNPETPSTPPVRPSVPTAASPSPPTQSVARGNAPPTSARGKSPAGSTPTAEELGLFRALQSTALDARRRAADAGASVAQLDSGDQHNKRASALVLEGRMAEAGAHLNQAAVAWSAAERTARLANSAAAAAPVKTISVDPPKQQAAPPVVAAVSPPQTPPPAVAQQNSATPVPAPPNPTAEIAAAVAAYARALETRDVGAVRRAYPSITASQAKGWEQFFSTLRTLRVTLAVNGLDVTGTTADAKVSGTYDYVTDAGRAMQQPVSFQASFRRTGSVWQLAAVH
jgi:eukaryotic-like serine/threonine-protein kinase